MPRPVRLAAVAALTLVLTQSSGRPFQALVVGGTRIDLGESISFDSARVLLGSAVFQGRGDASESLHWLCYVAGTGADRSSLFLEGSEMGAGRYLTGFTFARAGEDAVRETECSPLATSAVSITTDRGIQLGMSRSEVETILGRPTFARRDSVAFERTEERKGRFGAKENVEYTDISVLHLRFRNGVVVWMRGERVDIS